MSTYQLLMGTLAEGADFMRLLLKLGRHELRDQCRSAARGSALGAAAAIGLFMAAMLILIGIVEFIITLGLAAYLAFFITGGVLALISIIIALLARGAFKSVTLRPELALDQIHRFSTAAVKQREPDEFR